MYLSTSGGLSSTGTLPPLGTIIKAVHGRLMQSRAHQLQASMLQPALSHGLPPAYLLAAAMRTAEAARAAAAQPKREDSQSSDESTIEPVISVVCSDDIEAKKNIHVDHSSFSSMTSATRHRPRLTPPAASANALGVLAAAARAVEPATR